MNFKKLLMISLILLFVLSVGFSTASAIDSDNLLDENNNINVNYIDSDNSDSILISDNSDDVKSNNLILNNSINKKESNDNSNSNLNRDSSINENLDLENNYKINEKSAGLKDNTNTIYVSVDGNDENDGLTLETAVANISKAVSLAGEGYTIHISSGTYEQNKSTQLSHAFNFIGEDGTIIKRIGTANAFTYTSDTKKTINFKNIIFSSTTPNPNNPILSMAGGADLQIDNCTFTDAIAGRNGLIRYLGSSTGKITNTNFIGLTGSTSASSSYITALAQSKVKVENCTFANINEPGFLNSLVYVNNNETNLTLVNCVFTNITGNLNAVVNNRGYMQIKNCSFTDISLSGNSPRGIVWSSETIAKNSITYINSSVFINNSVNTEVVVNSSVIQAKSPTIVEYSAFLDNDVVFIINNDNDTDVTANYNWWGTNEDPKNCSVNRESSASSNPSSSSEEKISLVSDGVTVDNWAIMTVDLETSGLIAGEEYPIIININKYMNERGEIDSSVEYGISGAEILLSSQIGTFNSDFIIYNEDNGNIIQNQAKVYTNNGAVTVFYKGSEEGSDILNITSGYEEIIYNLEFGQSIEYNDIYVSKDGNDNNDGLSNETSVLTIARALEIGENLNSNIRIHIGSGSYHESGFELNGTYTVQDGVLQVKRTTYSFIGYGNVVIDGDGQNISLFTVRNNSVSYKNIRFTNVDGATYGGAINGDNLYRRTAYIDLTINNCTFDDLNVKSSGGAIYLNYVSGRISINNTKFYNLTTNSSWGGAISAEEAFDLARVKVTNSDFRDNYANNAPAMYLRVSNVTVLNSNFINNSAKYYPGAIHFYNASAIIENCVIANNSAKKDSAAIKISEGTNDVGNKIIIKSCIIENNSARDEISPAIYVEKGALDISYSSVVNDLSIATRTYYSNLYGLQQGVAIANNNWWGLSNPFGENEIGGNYSSLLGGVFNGSNITVDSWVILNAVLNDTGVLKVGNIVNISIDFNHVNTTRGEIELLSGGKIPKEYTLRLNATGGIVYPNYMKTVKGEANSKFTVRDLDNLGDDFASCGFDIISDNEITHMVFEINNYKGVIFVSMYGDDDCNGSMDAPVRTINKSIELALDEEFGSHEIFVLPGTYEAYGIELDSTYLSITGSGRDSTILDGVGYTGGIFNIFESELTVKNLTVINGVNTVSSGGAFTNMGNLTLEGVNVSNCQVRNANGAAIYSVGNLNLINSSFVKNTALSGNYANGGVIYADGYSTSLPYPPSLNITDCEFISNAAQGSTFGGGVIYAQYLDGYKSIKNSKFINNTAEFGGAIFLQDSEGDFIIDNTSFIGNKATGQAGSTNPYYGGGALNLIGRTDGREGNFIITNSLFINNSAKNSRGGGAILDRNVDLNITNSVFLNNTDTNKSIQVFKDTTVYFPSGGRISLEDNWWGANELSSLSTAAANVTINRWVVMNLSVELIDDLDSWGLNLGNSLDDGLNTDLGNTLTENNLNNYLVKVLLNEYNDGTLIDNPNYYPLLRLYTLESSDGEINPSSGILQNNCATALLSSSNRENVIRATIDGETLEFNTIDLYTKTVLDIKFDSPVKAGENLTVYLNLTDIDGNPINGTVILNISSDLYETVETVNVTEGKGFKEFSGLKVGVYTVLANYYGQSIYLDSNDSKVLEISPISSYLDLESKEISIFLGFGNLTGTLRDDNGPISNRNVSLIIDNDTILNGLTDESGQFIIDLSSLKVGNYSDLELVFEGDGDRLSSSDLVNITVKKIVLNLNLIVEGDSIVVNLSIDDSVLDYLGVDDSSNDISLEGLTVLAFINETDRVSDLINKSAITDEKGIATIDISDLSPGNFTALVGLEYNDNFEIDSNKVINFSIDRYKTNLTAIIDENNSYILISLTSDNIGLGSKTIGVTIGNESFDVITNSSGLYGADISDLAPGYYDCLFVFDGDDYYDSSSDSLNFTIENRMSELTAIIDDNYESILISLTCDGIGLASKTISVTIGNESGFYSLDIGDLAPGYYDCLFVFDGDDYYDSSSDSLNFTIDKYSSDLTALISEDSILISLSSNNQGLDSKTISVTIGNESFDVITNSSGFYSLDISGLVPGDYIDCLFVFAGDDYYDSSSDSLNFTIDKYDTKLDAKNTIGSFALVNLDARLTSGENALKDKSISLHIANKTFTKKTDDQGKVVFDLSSLDPGNYIALLSFAGDEYYNNSTVSVEVIINKLNADLSSEFKDKKLYISLSHKGSPVKYMNLAIEIIDSSNKSTVSNALTDNEGHFIMDLSDLSPDNYTAVVKAIGDKIYNPASDEIEFVIEGDTPSKSTRTAADLQKLIDDASSGDTIDLGEYDYLNVSNINITKDIVLIGNNTSISSLGDGNPIFNIATELNSVKISGIDFNASNGDVIVKAIAQNGTDSLSIIVPSIEISNNTVMGDNIVPESITILELDSDRGVLAPNNEICIANNTLEIGMKPFEFKVKSFENDSSANVPIGGGLTGKKTSIIHYENMDTVAVNMDIEGRVGKYFEVNLTDSDGNPLADKKVQIGFNGVVYNRTTNATGGVKLQINLGYKGTYTFAISYLGDDEYNGSFVVAKIKVSTQKTSLTSTSKTYKASAKTKTLTATLKDSKGNFIAGKTVKFTLNGKSYSAKTNAKGLASVNVSISSKKTYSFTAKYAGDDMYASSSASAKLVIK